MKGSLAKKSLARLQREPPGLATLVHQRLLSTEPGPTEAWKYTPLKINDKEKMQLQG